MRPTRKLDERAEQGAAQRNLDGEHHQDEQDNKVKFDAKHEGADAASGVNPSEGEAQAVKRDVRRAERREDESRREAQNIACRSVMSKNQARASASARPRPTSSAANGLGSDAAVEVWNTAASLGERQARRRGNNTARGKGTLPEAATPHLITSQCLRGNFRGKICEGGPEREPQRPEPEPKARAVMGHVEGAAHSSR